MDSRVHENEEGAPTRDALRWGGGLPPPSLREQALWENSGMGSGMKMGPRIREYNGGVIGGGCRRRGR